jgi:hypothetical protein
MQSATSGDQYSYREYLIPAVNNVPAGLTRREFPCDIAAERPMLQETFAARVSSNE